ncbi:MAG: NAD-dependent deacylase, partial [Thermus caldifontis]
LTPLAHLSLRMGAVEGLEALLHEDGPDLSASG